MKIGDIVYHVANPAIKGIVAEYERGIPENCSYVIFSEVVAFSGASKYGFRHQWVCSDNLLHKTKQKALKAHKPGHR